ncbi:VTT domain-containing protein [Synechococcus sp. CBW1004]|uniref:VTT domain-containing protein n=1 Tax=Synechococcus sp. CBW1004 TaxID=1353136 RepID=UPI0018CEC64D|nr:VTT domain-containing protein [Synechococcus sp. CBW1004]QPN64657.1 VTT domain-containing protein [Synechococcus sp. CBW1004]
MALAVGLGLPAGALVVGGGVLFGPWVGLVTVLSGEVLGLTLNWRLCRGVLRPRLQPWLERRRRGRRLRRLLQQPASLRLMVMVRLALLPMNLVNASCALSPTPLRTYALGSLALLPRFTLMVLAGALGGEVGRGGLSPLALTAWLLGLVATAAVLWTLGRGLRRVLLTDVEESAGRD